MSSLYFAAGAASGLVEGYVLLCRTLASELTTGGKGLLGIGGSADTNAGDEECPVLCEAELQDRIMQRIASVPRGMSAADLAAEIASDPSVQAALPEGMQVQLEFVNFENGEVLEPSELNGVYTLANGHAEGYGNGLHLEPLPVTERSSPRAGMVVRGAWWSQAQQDALWSAGVGPIRHRRPATARLCLSKFLMRRAHL